MKRLALAVLLAVCGVNADDYEEFLEYKKWQEQKAKSQGKNTAKDSAKANATDSTQEDYKNLLKSRKDSNGDLSQGNSTKTSDSAKNMANKTQDSTKSLDSKSISQLKSGGFIGVNLGGGLTMDATLKCSGSCVINGSSHSGSVKSTFNLSFFDIGILGGYTHFFIPYVGLRGYGGFDYGIAIGEKVDNISGTGGSRKLTTTPKANYYLLTVGADLLAEYAFGENRHFSVGAVVGLGGGYMMYRSDRVFNNLDWFNKFGLIFNAGVSFGFLHKHRIELLARLTPFIDFIGYDDNAVRLNGTGSLNKTHSQVKWLGLLSYKYTF